MDIILKNGTIPIYEQVYQQLKRQIMDNTLQGDDELPSIRSLAKSLDISVITIKKAYELLVSSQLAYSIPGKGFYVATVDLKLKQSEITKKIEEELTQLDLLATSYDLSLQDIFERRMTDDSL
ncbi:MAG: winged helix-turn-helix domain-containing protein [Vagococcus sp.]|uniref:GntR family transcriptional regulator n=1 Tax=Vagococcus sp. TaxID=1933889 RepID=UPI002FCBB4F2